MFNATFDTIENRWKALSNYEMLQARKFAENVYYHEYARELRSFGYEIENKPRGDIEIKGVIGVAHGFSADGFMESIGRLRSRFSNNKICKFRLLGWQRIMIITRRLFAS